MEHELVEMKKSILDMGKQTCTAVEKAISALLTNDLQAADEARALEQEVNSMFAVIDKRCLSTLANGKYERPQLSFLLNSLKIAIELERICDYANKIAKLVQKKFSQQDMQVTTRLGVIVSTMKAEALGMLESAIMSYEVFDLRIAASVKEREEIVDQKNEEVFRNIVCILSIDHWVQEIVLDYHVAVRYIERAADRALNIAEFVCAIVHDEAAQQQENLEGIMDDY